MQALFIGHAYIDVVLVADHMPTGDDKAVAERYAVSFGGNAVTAAFACARLGITPDLVASLADDWLGRMFLDMASRHRVSLHPRKVASSSLSFVLPKAGKRAILRCRDDVYRHPFPVLNLAGCRVLHVDGHQPDAALHYARACREAGILTSLDGGAVRDGTAELLRLIDVAVVAERMCEQMQLSPAGMLEHLRSAGAKVGAVTMGERGVLWYEGGSEVRHLPALPVPAAEVIDTNGAGDVFHGAYVYSFLRDPGQSWLDHFQFARAAAAHKIRHLGNEAGLPTVDDVARIRARWPN
jgi:sugar/nucleoside kinase (ribokinase family)